MTTREAPTRCGRCGHSYRSRNTAWVCQRCEADVIAEALEAIAGRLARAASARNICRYDGCLLIGSGSCPACQVRLARHHARSLQARNAGAATAPAGWVRKGLIYVKERAA